MALPRVTVVGSPCIREIPVQRITIRSAPPISAHFATMPEPAATARIGSPFASTFEAPGRGFHWGMATPNASLPRGVRGKVGQHRSLDKLLFGPTSRTDGTENLVGALKTSMATCGALTIQEFHGTRMVVAPAIKTEGKIYQIAQGTQR